MTAGMLRALPEGSEARARHYLTAIRRYPAPVADAVIEEARRFPGRYAYTPDRFAWVVHHMPAGRWASGDSTESETRIAALGRNRRQRLT